MLRIALTGGLGAALTAAVPQAPALAADAGATVVRDAPRTAPAASAGDREALSRIRSLQETAWARGDGRAYASAYTEDGDLVNIMGEHMHSRHVIATRMQRYFQTVLKNTRLHELQEDVRFVAPSMAIIVRKGCVLYPGEKACRPENLSVNTSVAVKNSGTWRISSFQNTLVRRGR